MEGLVLFSFFKLVCSLIAIKKHIKIYVCPHFVSPFEDVS